MLERKPLPLLEPAPALARPDHPPKPPKPPRPVRKARLPIALTNTRIKNAAPGTMISDGASRGLWLRTTLSGRKQWVHRYQFKGTRREAGLGSLELVSLEEARAAVIAARKMMHAGVDPLEARRTRQREEKKATTTFRDALEGYLSAHAAKWSRSDRMAAEWRNSLQSHLPDLVALPITAIDTFSEQNVDDPGDQDESWRGAYRAACSRYPGHNRIPAFTDDGRCNLSRPGLCIDERDGAYAGPEEAGLSA